MGLLDLTPNIGEQRIVGLFVNGVDSTLAPSGWLVASEIANYFALFKDVGGTPTEVSGPGYARIQCTSWTGEQNGETWVVKNANALTWTSGGGWGIVKWIGLFAPNDVQPFMLKDITPRDMDAAGNTLSIPVGGASVFFAGMGILPNQPSNFTLSCSKMLAQYAAGNSGGTISMNVFVNDAADLKYKAYLYDSGGQYAGANENSDNGGLGFRMSIGQGSTFYPQPASLNFLNNSGQAKTPVALVYRLGGVDVIKVPLSGITHQAGTTLTFAQNDLVITVD